MNILLWSKNYNKLLKTTELAQKNNYLNKYNIVLKKSLAYKGLANYAEGIDYIESNNNYLDSAAIKSIYSQMVRLNKDKAASLYYAIDLFEKNNPNSQHLLYADYAFKIGKHTLIGRLNYANRFNLNDLLLEADYYHLFRNGQYLYANYGVGFKNDLFPQHRAGLEYFLPLFNTFEVSAGGRFMNFGNKNIYIIRGNGGK